MTYTTSYFKILDSNLVYHSEVDLREDSLGRVRTVVSAIKERLTEALTSSLQPTVLFRDPYPICLPGGSSKGPPFPPNPPGGGASTGQPMANPQGNPHPPPFTKHSYQKFKGRGDDDDADSYIKLFESVSINNKEDNDADRMRIFPSLLRKRARSWFNHESIAPTGIDTWE